MKKRRRTQKHQQIAEDATESAHSEDVDDEEEGDAPAANKRAAKPKSMVDAVLALAARKPADNVDAERARTKRAKEETKQLKLKIKLAKMEKSI